MSNDEYKILFTDDNSIYFDRNTSEPIWSFVDDEGIWEYVLWCSVKGNYYIVESELYDDGDERIKLTTPMGVLNFLIANDADFDLIKTVAKNSGITIKEH